MGSILYTLACKLVDEHVNHGYYTYIDLESKAALDAARNNPGNRILVVTNIQYCHHIRPLLQQ